jgi:hypothetical protein
MTKTVDDYAARITQFHYHRPRFQAEVRALASSPVQVGETAASLPEAFDLDLAAGVQLDAVGQWVGRDRFVPYPFESFWFSFDEPTKGFDMAVWRGPYDTTYGTYRLGDEDFRDLLYAQIALNQWDGTTESLSQALTEFYQLRALNPDCLIFFSDNGNLSFELDVSGEWPPPMVMAMMAWPALDPDVGGMKFRTQVTSVDGLPLFGFDMNNDYIAGFDDGAWGVSPGELLFDRGTPGSLIFSDPANSGLIGGAT